MEQGAIRTRGFEMSCVQVRSFFKTLGVIGLTQSELRQEREIDDLFLGQ
jgi:hypothetical protein